MKSPFVMLLLCSITVSSCQKFQDYLQRRDEILRPDCQIENIVSSDPISYRVQLSYHPDGYPMLANVHDDTYPGGDATEFTISYVYDSLKRLVGESSDYVYLKRGVFYAYDGNSKLPVRDTVPGLFGDLNIEELEYDALGRIIKVSSYGIGLPDEGSPVSDKVVYKYFYDLKGNRQEDPSNPDYQGVILYTSKPSLYSLHSVWKLIHKDYSRNSVDYAESYNDRGLPLIITRDTVPRFQPFLDMYPGSGITYACN
ncbi:MAG TPA: hypothetical protein VK618_14020, partial [Flavitalea sp.]|nr:hypothetical protein [Flavitalea sp.]